MYNPINLSALTYANGFTVWHYKSNMDTLDVITAPFYFNEAAGMLRVGDRLYLNAVPGRGPVECGSAFVVDNAAGQVEISLTERTAVPTPSGAPRATAPGDRVYAVKFTADELSELYSLLAQVVDVPSPGPLVYGDAEANLKLARAMLPRIMDALTAWDRR